MPDENGNPTFGDRYLSGRFSAPAPSIPTPAQRELRRANPPSLEEKAAFESINQATQAGYVADQGETSSGEALEMVPEIIGSVVGGGVGGRVAAARKLPALAGRVIGSTIGGALGGAETAAVKRKPISTEAIDAGVRSALGEAIGFGVEKAVIRPLGQAATTWAKGVPGLRRLVQPTSPGDLVEGAEQTLSIVQGGKRGLSPAEIAEMEASGTRPKGPSPTAGQLTSNRFVDLTEEVAEAGLFSKGGIRAARERAAGEVQSQLEGYIARFGDSQPRVAGGLLQTALRNGAEGHRAIVDGLEQSLTSRYGGVSVDMQPFRVLAGQLENSLTGLSRSNAAAEAVTKDAMESVATFASGATVPLRDAMAVYRDLGNLLDAGKDVLPDKTMVVVETLRAGAKQRIELGLAASGSPTAIADWREVEQVISSGKTKFNNAFMRQWIDSAEPSQIVDALAGAPPERIRSVRRIVGEAVDAGRAHKDTWRRFQGAWLDDAIRSSEDVTTHTVSGEKLLKHIAGAKPGTFAEVFPAKSQRDAIMDYARALTTTQRRAVEHGGETLGVALKLTQVGAILNLTRPSDEFGAGGKGKALSLAIALGPSGAGKILADPAMVRFLTVGASRPSARVLNRLGSAMLVRLDQILAPEDGAFMIESPEKSESNDLSSVRLKARVPATK